MSNPVMASDIDPEDVDWLAESTLGQRIPRKMISVVAGRPDKGKGLFATYVAAAVSAEGGNVLYSAAEDSASLMTRPRLEAAGADLDRIHIPTSGLRLPEQMRELYEIVRELEIDLIVLDPIASHLGAGVSRHSDSIRKVTDPLKLLIESTGATVLIIEHALKRPPKSGHPLDAIGGTGSGLVAAARACYVWGSNPDSEEHRVLATAKFNIGMHPKALSFEIDVAEIDIVGDVPFLSFDEELVAFDPMRVFHEHMPKPGTVGRPPDKRAAAAEWLTTYLADAGAPVKTSVITEDAKQYGMSRKTLMRAADDMGIVKSAKGGPNVTWDLPDEVKELMGLEVADEPVADAAEVAEDAVTASEQSEDAMEAMGGISLEDGLNALLGGDEAGEDA